MKRFLEVLLTGKANKKAPSPKIDMLTQSFSQDLIYAVTGGRHKPPKHIQLSYGVKTLTGNVELIQIRNRLGHAVSYSQLEDNGTALCLQKIAATSTQGVVLPENIQPYIFTNLAFDNIDRPKETLTGRRTSHRVSPGEWHCRTSKSVWSTPSENSSYSHTKDEAAFSCSWRQASQMSHILRASWSRCHGYYWGVCRCPFTSRTRSTKQEFSMDANSTSIHLQSNCSKLDGI